MGVESAKRCHDLLEAGVMVVLYEVFASLLRGLHPSQPIVARTQFFRSDAVVEV